MSWGTVRDVLKTYQRWMVLPGAGGRVLNVAIPTDRFREPTGGRNFFSGRGGFPKRP